MTSYTPGDERITRMFKAMREQRTEPLLIDLVDLQELAAKVYGIPPSAWVDYDPPTPYTTEANPEPSE